MSSRHTYSRQQSHKYSAALQEFDNTPRIESQKMKRKHPELHYMSAVHQKPLFSLKIDEKDNLRE